MGGIDVIGARLARSGAGRAAAGAAGVLRGYSGEGAVGLAKGIAGNRHMIGFASTQALHPRRLVLALDTYRVAMARQADLFVAQRVDDVTDAVRHANASSMVVDRLGRSGVEPGVAADFMRRLGHAHEADSGLTGIHRAASEVMDLHNNDLGIELGLAHLRSAAGGASTGPQALEGAVLRAVADGRALVLDTPAAAPRASTAAELARLLRDPAPLSAG